MTEHQLEVGDLRFQTDINGGSNVACAGALLRDREAWRAAVHGAAKSQPRLHD